MNQPTEFEKFMTALSADSRIGRFVAPMIQQQPETVVLTLALALADAAERKVPE